jgi:predicted transposase YbfD/YdcC
LNRTREICKSGKITTESVYLITNLTIDQADAAQIMNLKREYWAIENKLHYRKDFVFGEDRSTIRAKFGPQNMATLRNFAISFLMANSVDNVKRCVDNFKYQRPLDLYAALFQKAA